MEGFQNWSFNVEPEDEKKLRETGREEHRLLAKRFGKRLPDLLDRDYDSNSFEVMHIANRECSCIIQSIYLCVLNIESI